MGIQSLDAPFRTGGGDRSQSLAGIRKLCRGAGLKKGQAHILRLEATSERSVTRLPRWSLQAIVRQLKDETAATIALCQLSIGEDLTSNDPFQQQLNPQVLEFNEIIRDVVRDQNVVYVPVYEFDGTGGP